MTTRKPRRLRLESLEQRQMMAGVPVTVMSQNLYLGADLTAMALATLTGGPVAAIPAATKFWEDVQKTNFNERADAIVDQIVTNKPALVGLQEVMKFWTGDPDSLVGNPTKANHLELDFLQILEEKLADKGLPYEPVDVNWGSEQEFPAFVQGNLRDIRGQGAVAIIARKDLAMDFSNIQVGPYWHSVDVTYSGSAFRFINMCLATEVDLAAQQSQASELLAGPAATNLPVILVGDSNTNGSPADGKLPLTYTTLTGTGFKDAWVQTNPNDPGYTWGNQPDLQNEEAMSYYILGLFGHYRMDLVLYRGAIQAESMKRVGVLASEKTVSGLWPSDHAGVVATLAVTSVSPPQSVTVMSENLYLGADLSPIIWPILTGSPEDAIPATTQIWIDIQATKFNERADAIVQQILANKPDLIGLQEVMTYRTGVPDGVYPNATEVELDFLEVLQEKLLANGCPYETLVLTTENDNELPAYTSPGVLRDLRMTDQVAILARADLENSGVEFYNPQGKPFVANVTVPTLSGTPFVVQRGWNSIDVNWGGSVFRFVNMCLEVPAFPVVQALQAAEIATGPAAPVLPVILVGDSNSDGKTSWSYQILVGAGFKDAWLQTHPGDPGYTWGNEPKLQNDEAMSNDPPARMDLILHRGPFKATSMQRLGVLESEKTVSGLWPSDHAGIVATLAVTLPLWGTGGDDTFTFAPGDGPGRWVVWINGVRQDLEASDLNVKFDGLGGDDHVEVTGTSGPDSATLYPSSGTFIGEGYTLTATNVESIDYDGAGGTDIAILHGGPGSDTLTAGGEGPGADPQRATLVGDGVSLAATAEMIYAYGHGGDNTAYLYTSSGDDVYQPFWRWARMWGDPHAAVAGDEYYRQVTGFRLSEVIPFAGEGAASAGFREAPSGGDMFPTMLDDSGMSSDTASTSSSSEPQTTSLRNSAGTDKAVLTDVAVDDDYRPAVDLSALVEVLWLHGSTTKERPTRGDGQAGIDLAVAGLRSTEREMP